MPEGLVAVLWAILKATIALAFIGLNFMFLVWLERKVSARIQYRVGPYRVGKPHGWLQLIADAIKMFSKEDVMPAAADRWVWAAAPVVVFAPAVLLFVILPVGPDFGVQPDFNLGLLFLSAVSSFTLFGIFMAGWGSNNKYSLIGAMRAAAQLMAYEIPLVLAVLGVVMLAGSLSLQDIVEAQRTYWFVFPQFLGFIVFLIAAIAELNRTPFDMAEAESELVAGYFTEYSGIRWGMFMFAEYTNLFTMSAIAASLFFGGWNGPLLPPVVWFLIKTYAFVLLAMWIRWTLPRIRIDQLLDLGWKFLVPVGLLNLVITGLFLV